MRSGVPVPGARPARTDTATRSRHPDSDFLIERTIPGRKVRLHRMACRCGQPIGEFRADLGDRQTWRSSDHQGCQGGIAPLVDPEELIRLTRAPSERKALAREIERFRSRGDRLGTLLATAPGRLVPDLPPEAGAAVRSEASHGRVVVPSARRGRG